MDTAKRPSFKRLVTVPMEKSYLFLCGECADKFFLRCFPVPIAPEGEYTLKNYALCSGSGRSYLVRQEGAETTGLLCPADGSLLWAMDQWKNVPLLRREQVVGEDLPGEGGLFVYFLNAILPPEHEESSLSLEEALDVFLSQFGDNKFGKCDVHLMVPCSFEKAPEELFNGVPADAITTGLIENLERVSQEEFCPDDFSCEENIERYLKLEHRALGVCAISIGPSKPGEKPEVRLQQGLLYFSRHKATQCGSINLVFPSTAVSALQILNYFCGNMLYIPEGGELRPFLPWLAKRWKVQFYGTPRAVLFAFNPLTEYQILQCLALESVPMGTLIGPSLREYATDNVAQYDVADVYVSPKCLVEVEHSCQTELAERLELESIEIFFVELLLLQNASTRRVCQKVLDYMNSEEVLSGEKNYDRLIALSNEMSSAILFFDYNYFLFPTVSIACQKISKRFGMDVELEKYREYRAILEQMIDLAHEEREKIENDNMNLLLLILTVVQVLPTLIETFVMLLTDQWSFTILGSWALSIGVCAALCGLFDLYKHRQVRRASQRHKRRTKN